MTFSIRPHELETLIDRIPDGIRFLSLDCFDTLLWRDGNAPRDVFADLTIAGGAVEPRQRSERSVRQAERMASGSTEVGIEAIHAAFRAGQDDDAIAASIQQELDAEARHCFGFAPTIALMRAAKARGLSIIIVSDTYLNHVQLRELISRAAGADVAAMIDHIFCSSEHGASKVQGLFDAVLDALDVAPASIFHLGDNKAADFTAPQRLAIPAAHLVQFDADVADRLRLEGSVAQLIDPAVRVTRPAYQPQRPLVAMREAADIAARIGHDILGPLLTGFSGWLRDEAAELAANTGRKTHILFLLRDGFLQAGVHDILFGSEGCASIELSRLTAIKASLTDEEAIHRHLTTRAGQNSARTIGEHLHFTPAELPKQFNDKAKGDDPGFLVTILAPNMVRRTTKRASDFARRLCKHLQRAGVEAGDAVVLADLGYNGTVQNMAQAVLEREMNLTVAGRYLLLRESVPSGLDKRGYFDTRHYDYNTLDTLAFPIAVLEQFCTIAQGSVIDYRSDGSSVRSADKRKGAQSDLRDAVQAACLDYARRVVAWPGQWSAATDDDAWLQANCASLARFLFLPSHEEVALIEAFEHDANFGSSEMLQMVDTDRSVDELRRQGMISVARARRMFVPGELRRHGVPLSLSLLATHRFQLEWNAPDFNGQSLSVPVILATPNGETTTHVSAYPTHDGYYCLRIPVGKARYNAAILWGQGMEWLEIADMRFQRLSDLNAGEVAPGREPAAHPVSDGMTHAGGALFRCDNMSAMSFVPAPEGRFDEPLLLAVTFRPIVLREAAATVSLAA